MLALRLQCLLLSLYWASSAFAQESVAHARITGRVDDTQLVTLHGNTHPLAQPEFDQGTAPDELPTRRMLLLLSRAPEQQAALDKFVEAQRTPGSVDYRRWLTPLEFGRRFGPADADVQTVTNWLQQQGFSVARVAAGKSVIEFSGSAGQVRQAFHTELHKYVVNGQENWANAQDPRVPAALAPVVHGLVSLNNFREKPLSYQVGVFSRDGSGVVAPATTLSSASGTYYALGPADFATIYNTGPVLQSGNNGKGQTIAVLGRSNVHLQDITDFRNLFGLGAGNTSVVIDGPDPGIVPGDESESVLDLEWANAVAPGASVILVTAQDTETTRGPELAALRAIEDNVAGIVSLSYSSCEAHLGTSGNQYIQSLWEQAAAQGITVMVSTGDAGAAGCDNPNTQYIANSGTGVNGLASTAFNVAVGGTDFDDATTQSQYWSSTNVPVSLGSAQSYIPETTWNQSCAASATVGNLNVCPAMPATGPPAANLNLHSGSGGQSSCAVSTSSGDTITCQSGRPKPAWQTGIGVPADGVRDLPDVSLFSAAGSSSKSFYIVCEADQLPLGFPSCQPSSGLVYFLGAGGTSAAAPSFAGIMALAQQKTGSRLGNVNYLLYSLAAGSGASCASAASPGSSCIFNDVIKGNNSVPCQAGSPNCSQSSGTTTGVIVDSSLSPAYSASSGYDLATGLGSVNGTNLISAIAKAVNGFTPTSTALTLNGSNAAITAQHGNGINVAVNVSPSGSGDVSLLGASGAFDFGVLSGGSSNWTSTLFPGGTYTVTAHYPGDGTHASSDSSGISVTINPEPSQSFINLVSFDAKGVLQSFTGNSLNYGSNYLLRVDVTDAAGNVSSAQGVSSKCSNHIASCPTGTVTVTANGSPLDGGSLRLNSKGFAEDQIIQLNAGTYTLGTSYSGDPSYGTSNGSSAVSILKAPTTLTGALAVLPPYQYGTPYQINATLATASSGAAPSGTLSFIDNGVAAGTSVHTIIRNPQPAGSNGYASLTFQGFYATPTVGAHTVSAQFSGDPNYADSSSSSFSFTVGKADTRPQSYSVSPMNTIPTLPVTLYAQFFTNSQMAEPTGTITFYDNGTPIAGTVTYAGRDGSWNNSSAGNFIASYSGQLITTFTQLGNHTITVTYAGDANYNPTTQSLGTLVVASKLPVNFNQFGSSMSPALVNYPTNLSASVYSPSSNGTPQPTGTFTFFDNGQQLSGTIASSNPGSNALAATMPYTFTATGTHSITVTYSGDSNYVSASPTQALSLSVIDKLPTTISGFGVSGGVVNQPVTLSLNVNSNYIYNGPVMTGTVTFQDGNTPIPGPVTYASQQGYMTASVPYTFTTAGTHNITVQYGGDTHYAPTSTTLSDTILGPLALQLLGGNSMTMPARGGAGFVNLNVINTTNSAMSVDLSCVSDSPSATCSVTSPFEVQANTVRGTTVNFNIPALTSSTYHANPFNMTFVFAGVLAGLSFASRKRNAAMLMALIAVMAVTLGSCGGGSGSSGNPGTGAGGSSGTPLSRTYKFTITGTSGANSDTQVLTVTVQ